MPLRSKILHLNNEALKKVALPYVRVTSGADLRLEGIIIDRLGEIFVLRTLTQAADQLISDITQILAKDLKASAILLKNNFAARAKKNLPLVDAILHGGVAETEIEVLENGQIYRYDLDSTRLFPFELSGVRKSIATANFESLLLLGCQAEDILPIEKLNKKNFVVPDGDFTHKTESLRSEKQASSDLYNAAVLVLHDRYFKKHQTSLFHLFYHFLGLMQDCGTVFCEMRDYNLYKQVLRLAGKKLSHSYKITPPVS